MGKIVDNPSDELDPTAEHAPMSEKLFELISNAIIDGHLSPGASITEPELARQYGVSRAPLREALRRLEERQLLQRNPYRGMRVVEPSARMIAELYEIREVLEGMACRRVALLITDADVARFRETLADERRAIASRSTLPLARPGGSRFLNFHTLIAEISGNQELLLLLNREIWRLLRADYQRRIHRPEELRKSHAEHLGILKALMGHDPDLAELLMRRHVVNTRLRREQAIADAAARSEPPSTN
jgi:DNA-binding GntR family transcriptional regulator